MLTYNWDVGHFFVQFISSFCIFVRLKYTNIIILSVHNVHFGPRRDTTSRFTNVDVAYPTDGKFPCISIRDVTVGQWTVPSSYPVTTP